MSSLTPERAALMGRIGGLTKSARHDPKDATAKPRAAFLSKFEREADPEGVLSPEERARRADRLRRAHFSRLALKSAEVRRAKKQSA